MRNAWSWLWVGMMCWGGLLQPAWGQHGPSGEDERLIPLAEVGRDSISLGLFKKTYVDFLIATGANDTEEHRAQHLATLIDTYLLAGHARQMGMDREPAYEAHQALQQKKVLGGRFYEVAVLDTVSTPDDAATRLAYARFTDRVHLRQLYFRYEADAEAAFRRLEAGEDFVHLANELYATPAFDSTAGDLGTMTYLGMDDALAEAAFALEERYTYTRPVQSRVGYHILRLENRYFTPIRTESGYQAKRIGLEQQLRLRRMRLAGDTFVRDLMDGVHYEVHRDAMLALRDALEHLDRPAGPQPIHLASSEAFTPEEQQALERTLTPETVLVTYTWNGAPRTFSAGDYFQWLPELPFAEARSNPAASVGRALRNEVLALAGADAGLDDDPIGREALQFEEAAYLARSVRSGLRRDTLQTPTPEQLRHAFGRLTRDRPERITVDFWSIPAQSREDAVYLQEMIDRGEERPDAFAGFQFVSGFDLMEDETWMRPLRQAPLGQSQVIGFGVDQWHLFQVTARREEPYVFEDIAPALARQLAPLAGEAALLDRLYRVTPIQVDSNRIHFLVP